MDIDNLKEPLELETTIPMLEDAQGSENETQRKPREARNKEVLRVNENAEDKKILEKKRKFRGMRRNETVKKVRSILYLALGAEGKEYFPKNTQG